MNSNLIGQKKMFLLPMFSRRTN